MSVVVSFRMSRKLKEWMFRLKHINLSEVVRRAIYEVVVGEEVKLRSRDAGKIREAILRMEKLSKRVEGWSSVEEIRRWRDCRVNSPLIVKWFVEEKA